MIQYRSLAVAWELNHHCLNFLIDLPVNDWQQHNLMSVFWNILTFSTLKCLIFIFLEGYY